MFKIKTLDHIAITVKDISQSIKWYEEILGLKHIYKDKWEGEPAFVVSEDGTGLALFHADEKGKKINAEELSLSMRHFAFRTDKGNFDQAQQHLNSKEISFRFMDHGVCRSIYFNDPDGYKVEITTYES
ncbi:N/A [soil metagenome]